MIFLISGLIHELVITFPAGAGYGLPTCYYFNDPGNGSLVRNDPVLGNGRGLAARSERDDRRFSRFVTGWWLFQLFALFGSIAMYMCLRVMVSVFPKL